MGNSILKNEWAHLGLFPSVRSKQFNDPPLPAPFFESNLFLNSSTQQQR